VKLTDKQTAKVSEIAKAASIAIEVFDPKAVKVARKIYADKIKALDKILAIIAPAKKSATAAQA
jgi:hypothetical protein